MLRSLLLTLLVAVVLFAFTNYTGKPPNDPKRLPPFSASKQTAPATKNTDATKETAFAQNLFRSLQTGNTALWLSLQPNALLEEIQQIKDEYADKPALLAQKMTTLISLQKINEAQKHTEEFAHLQSQAATLGLSWKAARFTDFDFDTTTESDGTERLTGDVWLEAGGKEYAIEGVTATQKNGQYRLESIAALRQIDLDE